MFLFSIIQMFDSPKRGQGSGAGHSALLQKDGICIKEATVQIDKADTEWERSKSTER